MSPRFRRTKGFYLWIFGSVFMSPEAIYVLTSSQTQLPALAAPSGDSAGTNGLTPTTPNYAAAPPGKGHTRGAWQIAALWASTP